MADQDPPSAWRTGDHVVHRPTGETWVVAYVDGDRLSWCGWPEGRADVADCERVHVATDDEHAALVREIAAVANDHRAGAVRRLYPEVLR